MDDTIDYSAVRAALLRTIEAMPKADGKACPMCGRPGPHAHTAEESTIFGNGAKLGYRISQHERGEIVQCPECEAYDPDATCPQCTFVPRSALASLTIAALPAAVTLSEAAERTPGAFHVPPFDQQDPES